MLVTEPIDTIDYLIMGHLTCDLVDGNCQLGGSAAYAALTARALGLRPGIVTSCSTQLPLSDLAGIPIINYPAEESTTFENFSSPNGRSQILSGRAEMLDYYQIPESWRIAPVVHLAPVAQEIEPNIVKMFSNPLLGITPQGWLREWDDSGKIHFSEWLESKFVLQHSGAAVISVEDVGYNEEIIAEFAASTSVLAVTEGQEGVRIYWHGDVRRFRPPSVSVIDTIGAGDIFAAAFFVRLYTTRDPWEAARFATHMAAFSVTRMGMDSIPTSEEIETCLVEVL